MVAAPFTFDTFLRGYDPSLVSMQLQELPGIFVHFRCLHWDLPPAFVLIAGRYWDEKKPSWDGESSHLTCVACDIWALRKSWKTRVPGE